MIWYVLIFTIVAYWTISWVHMVMTSGYRPYKSATIKNGVLRIEHAAFTDAIALSDISEITLSKSRNLDPDGGHLEAMLFISIGPDRGTCINEIFPYGPGLAFSLWRNLPDYKIMKYLIARFMPWKSHIICYRQQGLYPKP